MPRTPTTRELAAGTLRWTLGAFFSTVGVMMLVVPHQFSSVAYDAIRPALAFWGSAFLLLGIALLVLVVIGLPRYMETGVHLASGVALLVLTYGFVMVGGWTAVANFGVLGIGVAFAPFLTRRTSSEAPESGDLLIISAGCGAAVTGLLMLAVPGLFSMPVNDAARPYLVPLGLGFLCGGLSALYVQLRGGPPRVAYVGSHLILGGTLLVFCLISSVPLRAWIGIAYYGGFGLAIVLLPWLRSWLRSLDPSSIRTRMALTLALVASLPLVAAVTVISSQQEQSAIEQSLLLHETLASTSARGVADYLDVFRTAAEQVATIPGIAGLPAPQQREMLRNLTRTYPDALAFSTFDSAGNPIARSDDAPLTAASGFPIFEDAKRTKAPSSDVLISPVYHRLIFSFGAPILARDGSFAGLVAVALEPRKLSDILERADPGPGTEVTLVDGKGDVLDRSESPPIESLVDASNQPPVAALLAGESGSRSSLRYNGQGGEHLVGYGRLSGLGWGVVVDSREDVVLANARSQRDLAFAILIGCLIVSLVAGTLAANLLAHPLLILARAADRFSGGDATVPMPESSVREIGHLSSAFGGMRDTLLARTAEREKLLEENQRHSELLGAIYDASPGGLAVTVGPDLRFVYANPAYRRMSPYPELDPIGTTVGDIWPSSEGFKAVEVQSRVMETGESYDVQGVERRFPDGSNHFFAIHLRRLEWGVENAILTVMWETTESELARQTAEAAVKIRDEFISVAAHELKTPVTSLQGFAQLTLRELNKTGAADPERLTRTMERINQQSKRLTRLNEQLLNLSRLQSGKLTIQPLETDLATLVAGVVRDIGLSHPGRTIELRNSVEPRVLVDPLRMEQVVINLLDNAIKFSPRDSIVDVEIAVPSAEWVEIAVRDRGPGIPEEKRDYIFERFYQAHPERHYGGMGIGLFISREIAEMHGGTITVEQPEDGGSRFVVRLPLHPS